MNHLVHHPNHKGSVLSLFKELLTISRRFELLIDNTTPVYPQEWQLYRINPEKYRNYLRDEMFHIVRCEFKRKYTNMDEFAKSFQSGITALGILKSGLFNEIIALALDFRESQAQRNAHITNIYNDKGTKEFNGKFPEAITKHLAFPLKSYDQMTNSERLKRLKLELKMTKDNKHKVLRRYLKLLQMTNKLVVPQALAYSNMSLPKLELHDKIFGSTAKKALQQYNEAIVMGIMLPEMEYKLNMDVFMKKWTDSIDKGPFQPKIHTINAGPVPIPFIRLPYPQLRKMKEIAIDIKELVRKLTLKQMWESTRLQMTMPVNKDGSIDLSWYKKYGNSKMFSKSYYEYWHEQEAMWEYHLIYERLKQTKTAKEMESPETRRYLENTLKQLMSSWTSSIQDTNIILNAEISQYYQKYDRKYLQQVLQQQHEVLQQMEQQYQMRVDKYNKLIRTLNMYQVSPHSNLVDRNKVGTQKIHQTLIKNDHQVKHTRTGLESDRFGKRKQLADYMDDYEIPSFKVGRKYEKRI